MTFTRTALLAAVLIAPIAAADDDYYRQQQQQDMYRQQQQQELFRQQQQQELYRQQQQQQAQQQQVLARQQEQQRFERENLERQRVEQARLDQQRERETFRRRQDRDEDERRDENLAIQQRERDEDFQRQQDLRRRQTEWARQTLPTTAVPNTARPAAKTCRTVHFKTVGTLENFSDPKKREVTTMATLVSEAGNGVVGFVIREDNEGHMVTRFEASPTSKQVDLIYGEKCKTRGTNATCEGIYRAVRGSLEFEVLTTVSAPRGSLVAHVKGATLVEWDIDHQQVIPGGDCVTFEVFNYESTFLPK